MEVYWMALNGAIGGLAYSLSGLANKDTRESFRWGKFLPTLIISAIIGAIAGFTNQDYGIVANGAVAAGITVIVEKFFKSIYRRIK